MDLTQKVVNFMDTIFVTFKVTTRDLYVIPCANIKEFITLALMISTMSLTSSVLELPFFLDYRGCIIGTLVLAIVYLFTRK